MCRGVGGGRGDFPTHHIPVHSPTLLHPHTSFLASPHTPIHFPTPPPTLPIPLPTAPLTYPCIPTHFPTNPMHSPHIFPHSFDYVAKLPCDDVTLNKFNWKSPIKFFTTTGNLKSCFGVGNVSFRCMKVWRSYHVARLLWQSYHVTKLLATSQTLNDHTLKHACAMQ